MDQITNTVGTAICIGIIIGVMAVIAVLGTRSRMRFAKYLLSMSRKEQIEFSRKSLDFVATFWIGIGIGFVGILSSLVFKQESLVKYFFFGLFAYIFIMVILSLFVYRVPRNRK